MAGILLHKRLRTLESAADEEGDFLLAIQHQRAAEGFRQQISRKTESIAAVVRHHLRLHHSDSCVVLPPHSWIQGGFNLCVLVDIQGRSSSDSRTVVFRCPMPHKLAEQQYPGTIDEKVSCEAAAYAWIQDYCLDIRIPHLYAFGFTDGSQVRVSAFPVDPLTPLHTLMADGPSRDPVYPRQSDAMVCSPLALPSETRLSFPRLPSTIELHPGPMHAGHRLCLHAPRAHWARDRPDALDHLGSASARSSPPDAAVSGHGTYHALASSSPPTLHRLFQVQPKRRDNYAYEPTADAHHHDP